MLVFGSLFRQKSMKNRCQIWWLKRDRQNRGKVMIFPNDLRPLLGPISQKTRNKNEYGRFGAARGGPWALKSRSGRVLNKRQHFCHEVDHFLGPCSMKNRCKNRCEKRYRKSHENWWNFDAKMKPDLDTFRRRRSWKNVFFGKGECALYTNGLQ